MVHLKSPLWLLRSDKSVQLSSQLVADPLPSDNRLIWAVALQAHFQFGWLARSETANLCLAVSTTCQRWSSRLGGSPQPADQRQAPHNWLRSERSLGSGSCALSSLKSGSCFGQQQVLFAPPEALMAPWFGFSLQRAQPANCLPDKSAMKCK